MQVLSTLVTRISVLEDSSRATPCPVRILLPEKFDVICLSVVLESFAGQRLLRLQPPTTQLR